MARPVASGPGPALSVPSDRIATAPFRSPTGYKTRTRADSVDYLRRHAQEIVATLSAERVRLAAPTGERGQGALWGQYQFVFARMWPSQVSRARETRPLRFLPIFV